MTWTGVDLVAAAERAVDLALLETVFLLAMSASLIVLGEPAGLPRGNAVDEPNAVGRAGEVIG